MRSFKNRLRSAEIGDVAAFVPLDRLLIECQEKWDARAFQDEKEGEDKKNFFDGLSTSLQFYLIVGV